jgi:hypothetical protein
VHWSFGAKFSTTTKIWSFFAKALFMPINMFMVDCSWLIKDVASFYFLSISSCFRSTTPPQFNIPSTFPNSSNNSLFLVSYIQQKCEVHLCLYT